VHTTIQLPTFRNRSVNIRVHRWKLFPVDSLLTNWKIKKALTQQMPRDSKDFDQQFSRFYGQPSAYSCYLLLHSVAAEKSRHRYPRLSKLWPKKHGDMISHNKVLYDKPGWLWWRFKRRPWEHPSNMFRRLWNSWISLSSFEFSKPQALLKRPPPTGPTIQRPKPKGRWVVEVDGPTSQSARTYGSP
jgi:hypothetical protein